jgi:hypothetical protein
MDNVQGIAESPLLVFGGMAPETDPPSLPAGSAAIATDIDFTVTSARTRDGLANVYAYEGFDFNGNAGFGANIVTDPVGAAWASPDNIIHDSPPAYASVTLNQIPLTPTVNNGTAANSSGSTFTIAVIPDVTPINVGDTGIVVLAAGAESASPPSYDVSTFTDSAGNVWTLAVPKQATEWIRSSNDVVAGTVQVWTTVFAYAVPLTSTLTISILMNNVISEGNAAFVNVAAIGAIAQFVQGAGVQPAQPNSGSLTTPAAFLLSIEGGGYNVPTGPGGGAPTGFTYAGGVGGFYACSMAYQIAGPGTYTDTWTLASSSDGNAFASSLIAFAIQTTPTGSFSDILQATTYAASVPLTSSVLGIQFEIFGKQSSADPDDLLTFLAIGGAGPATMLNFQLPTSQGSITLGGPSSLLGTTWTPAQINNPGFGADIQAFASGSTSKTFDISAVFVTVWYTPPSIGNFNFVGSFEMTAGDTLTLALDDSGVFWQEDLENTPGVLTPFYTAIEPDTFADMSVQDDRAFIALSDLQGGTDMPRGYNGQWVDRLSQVGPGISPAFTATTTTYDIVSITQPPAVVNTSQGVPIRALNWSSGPGVKYQAGLVITIEYTLATATPDPNIYVGGGVVLSGFLDAPTGGNPNGSYLIVSVQTINTGNSLRNSFSVTAPTSASTYDDPPAGASYQASLATLTLTTPAQNVQVGSQILVAGASPAAWNDTWTILNALNAAQLQITATSLTSDVATYDFTIISGTAPTTGQQVTITGTTNGNGIFNVANGVINSASPTTFTLLITSPNIAPAAEPTGQAIVSGTIFQFDPGPVFVGATPQTPTSPFIIGNDTGGTIVQPGQLGSGTRMGTVLFLTRNGFLTAPGPPTTFTLNAGANSIVATNIPLGPPNVIARVIALTGANGAFFFWIPTPVTVTDNGQQVTYNATIINDNVTTQATFNITDAVLLAALSIDTDGSNNFAQVELGSSIGLVSYSQRLFAWGEQNKVQNFNNLSFDGGYLAQNLSTPLIPAGWTVDAINGTGGTLLVSPLFGNSYYIQNLTGSTQALYGMIEQSAYQDYNKVAILSPQTQYGVRVTASSPSGAASGNLVVDLFSPSFGAAFGVATIPLASLTPTMKIITLNLLTTTFTTQVPADLLLRLYASAIPNLGDVEIDRIEVYDLAQPVLSTQLRGSYFNNFEAFDGVTGNLGVAAENQQPVRNAFELFDNLYIIKTKSFVSTSDNGQTEPNFWQVREVSNKVGTPSIYGVDVGEGWGLVAGEAGLYVFSGGDPIKISPEIDPLWQTINWQYGYTLWLRNDTINRKILIGVPIPTPNQWMPNFPENANPTQPNVVLICNYKELMTSGALASEGPLRVAYTGELKSFPLGRKWSAWSIEACYADFITRPDTTAPVFFCGDQLTGKIYQQLADNYADDGQAMHCQYVTYPFPKTQEAQQQQMGMHQLLAHFMSLLVVGDGNLRFTIYPDSIESPDQETPFPEPLLNPPPYGDMEIPLNTEGNRFFVGLSVIDAGEWFDISRIVMGIGPNPWAPTRGSNS